MARVLRMPGDAADAREGVLSSWLVDETDAFDAAQTIAYVETSTLLLSVEAGRPGVLLKTLVQPGTHVDVGTPIGLIGDRDEEIPDLDGLLAELGVNGTAHATHRADPATGSPDPQGSSWFGAKPEVSAVGHEETIVRTPPATRLTHGPFRVTVRAERLVAMCAEEGAGLSVEHLVVRAVAAAHSQLPAMNQTRRPEGVRREETVDVGFAVGSPGGLVVPVLLDVATLTVRDIALLSADLAVEARVGRLRDDSRAGSIVVTSLGRHAIDEAVPHVAPPQVAALAMGGVRDEPVVEAGAIVAGKALTLTLSVDHDAVDDVTATRWLGVLAALLERPEWMYD